ncbi:MAG: nucleotide exchange factor GrpE [Verrucomicrobiae bacterium]|nr:nucleotide exchange factor GrpE [Verrucomicrobiae bacterium]
MSDQNCTLVDRWWFLVPFFIGDILMVTAAVLIYEQAGRPMNAVEVSAFSGCVLCGALLGAWPFVLRSRAAIKAYEVNQLSSTLSQIQRSEEVAQCISNATGQWQAVQEQAASTLATAREITENMATVLKEFRELFKRAADTERNNLRLEVSKLKRAEADWLHVLVRIMDHVYALYSAGVRSKQPNLIEQFTNFQNACRDAARRVGLVPLLAIPGTAFNPELHQVLNPNEPVPNNATVAEMLATGYAYQGQLIRRVLVAVRAGDLEPQGGSNGTENCGDSPSVSGTVSSTVNNIESEKHQSDAGGWFPPADQISAKEPEHSADSGPEEQSSPPVKS